jgi:hypothetical protein
MSVKVSHVLTRFKLITSQIQGRNIVASAYLFSNYKADLEMNSRSWGSGAYVASYPLGTGGPFPGAKQKGNETALPPSSARFKNSGAVPPPNMSSWRNA